MNETIEDIVREMRAYAKKSEIDGGLIDVWDWLTEFADRIEAAHIHEVNNLLKIDNACVAQCAVLLDDHIKAVVAEVKRRYANGIH